MLAHREKTMSVLMVWLSNQQARTRGRDNRESILSQTRCTKPRLPVATG